MGRIKGRLTAFTLMEILVVLIISSIITLLSYWALLQINRSFTSLSTKFQRTESKMQFEKNFQYLWNQSDSIFFNDSNLEFWIGGESAKYQFADSVHFTSSGHRLSFALDSSEFIAQQYFIRAGRDSLLQSGYFRTYSEKNSGVFELHFYKHYPKPLY